MVARNGMLLNLIFGHMGQCGGIMGSIDLKVAPGNCRSRLKVVHGKHQCPRKSQEEAHYFIIAFLNEFKQRYK